MIFDIDNDLGDIQENYDNDIGFDSNIDLELYPYDIIQGVKIYYYEFGKLGIEDTEDVPDDY